ncbi:MAG: hypothetical protein WDW38_003128 [Sanguina aurantia]
MQAITFSDNQGLLLTDCHPVPVPKHCEALIRVLRAGICSTDLEITKGYIPGYRGVLGHEFCGIVVTCQLRPELVGKRVVSEINCNDTQFTCSDALFQRNHAPGRSVLGIIKRDGALARFVCAPISNLHLVPDSLSDQQACFAEPLAAACRILEQGLPAQGTKVAVLGDKLGGQAALLLIWLPKCWQRGTRCVCAISISLFHAWLGTMRLVQGVAQRTVIPPDSEAPMTAFPALAGAFDLCIEATGSSAGIRMAMHLTRALGTVLLKSTVSTSGHSGCPNQVSWAELANDIVVNEKTLLGSRCGPIDLALRLMVKHGSLRSLVDGMTAHVVPISAGLSAMRLAATRGTMKVQVSFGGTDATHPLDQPPTV